MKKYIFATPTERTLRATLLVIKDLGLVPIKRDDLILFSDCWKDGKSQNIDVVLTLEDSSLNLVDHKELQTDQYVKVGYFGYLDDCDVNYIVIEEFIDSLFANESSSPQKPTRRMLKDYRINSKSSEKNNEDITKKELIDSKYIFCVDSWDSVKPILDMLNEIGATRLDENDYKLLEIDWYIHNSAYNRLALTLKDRFVGFQEYKNAELSDFTKVGSFALFGDESSPDMTFQDFIQKETKKEVNIFTSSNAVNVFADFMSTIESDFNDNYKPRDVYGFNVEEKNQIEPLLTLFVDMGLCRIGEEDKNTLANYFDYMKRQNINTPLILNDSKIQFSEYYHSGLIQVKANTFFNFNDLTDNNLSVWSFISKEYGNGKYKAKTSQNIALDKYIKTIQESIFDRKVKSKEFFNSAEFRESFTDSVLRIKMNKIASTLNNPTEVTTKVINRLIIPKPVKDYYISLIPTYLNELKELTEETLDSI